MNLLNYSFSAVKQTPLSCPNRFAPKTHIRSFILLLQRIKLHRKFGAGIIFTLDFDKLYKTCYLVVCPSGGFAIKNLRSQVRVQAVTAPYHIRTFGMDSFSRAIHKLSQSP